VTRVLLDSKAGELTATGVEYVTADGNTVAVTANREVILSAGAIGSASTAISMLRMWEST
jgi:hypothetical protein